jgi:PAS domain S-box-containing protein
MRNIAQYRPIPWFLPAIAAIIVLSVLFVFGLQEQQLLLSKSIDEAVKQRIWTSEQVARKIETTLKNTKTSSERLSAYLSSSLSSNMNYPTNEFETLFEKYPDKSIRSTKKTYNAKTQAGVWLPTNYPLSTENKTLIVKAKYNIEAYGLGAKQQSYVDTWFMPKSGGIVIFWPSESDFIYQAEANFSYSESQWIVPAQPENNPNKESYWTDLSLDPVPHIWMLSAVAPVYMKKQWIGSVGHDIPLSRILAETQLLNKQEHSRFILLTSKQQVVASDIYESDLKSQSGDIALSQLPDPRWKKAVDLANKDHLVKGIHKSYQLGGELFLVSSIKSQHWLLVTSMPLSPVTEKTNNSFNSLRNIAIGSILLEILIVSFILAWGHRRNIAYVENLKSIYTELNHEKLRYQNLVENVPSIVYRCKNDNDWTMVFINGACHGITGYSAEEILNNQSISFNELIHPIDRNHVRAYVQHTLTLKKQYEIIFRIIHKNGSTRWMLERGRYFNDDRGKLYLEGVITDITHLKEVELELKMLNEDLDKKVKERTSDLDSLNQTLNKQTSELKISLTELEQTQQRLIESEKITSLSNLVVGMAHELNTPLGNLLMLESTLEDQFKEIQEQFSHNKLRQSSLNDFFSISNKTLSSFNECTQKMVMLSESFKSIAIAEEVYTRISLNLKEQIENAISAHVSKLKNKSINVIIDISDDITIKSHATTLYQVFTHLISNSITHAFDNKASGNITVIAKCNTVETIIQYIDDGHGVPEDIQHRIFEPFTTNKRGLGSVGLGLNIVYNLITEGLNGNIKLIQKNEGVKFVITIPK